MKSYFHLSALARPRWLDSTARVCTTRRCA